MMEVLRSVFSKDCKTYKEDERSYRISGQVVLVRDNEERTVEIAAKIYKIKNEGILVDFSKVKGNSLDFNEAF